MVLVAVRHEEARDPVVVEGPELRVDHVDPEPAVVERHPAVDDQGLAALLEGEAVHADFAEATEDEDAQGPLLSMCGPCYPHSGPTMSTLADKRFVLVTGKGGVGKTTVCAAEALALAAKGKRVLVAMCNAKERLSAMLGSAPIGPTVDGRRAQRLGRQHAPREGARGVRRPRAPQSRPLQDALRQRVRAHVPPGGPRHAGVGDARQGVVAHDRAAPGRVASSTTSSSSTRPRRATGSTCCASPR